MLMFDPVPVKQEAMDPVSVLFKCRFPHPDRKDWRSQNARANSSIGHFPSRRIT
ncbi:Kruppel-like factor 3 (basic), isoform CRA_a [Mus musculus]|nr:Kruppel-like factor 3 (basic), isoform CRA_a [Mus musculus]